MKLVIALTLLIILGAAQSSPSIYFVSSDPSQVVRPVYSSLRGGKLIYIKAVGHDTNPSKLQIFVGPYPCIIPSDGVTDTFISCETTDTGLVSRLDNQVITLYSDGKSITTSYPNSVYFLESVTPYLQEIFPKAGYAGSSVNFYGTHEISDLGDGLRDMGEIIRLSLGEDLCSRFDVLQDTINPNYVYYVECVQSSSQEAGLYNVSELVVPGYANKSKYMRRSSLDPH